MDLGEALYRQVSGGRTPHSDPARDLREAQERAGGVSQLARALGVDRTTVQRWNRAGVPSEAGESLISVALRHARQPEGRVDYLARNNKIILSGEQEGRGDRTITLKGADLAPGMWRAVTDAYLAGGTAADLRRAAAPYIRDPFYRKLLTGQGRPIPGSNYNFAVTGVKTR